MCIIIGTNFVYLILYFFILLYFSAFLLFYFFTSLLNIYFFTYLLRLLLVVIVVLVHDDVGVFVDVDMFQYILGALYCITLHTDMYIQSNISKY